MLGSGESWKHCPGVLSVPVCVVLCSRMFTARCAQCGGSILPSDLVLKARGLVYHRHCFRCVVCARQLLPGDQFTLQPGGLHCQTEQPIPESPEEGGSGSPQPGLTGEHVQQEKGLRNSQAVPLREEKYSSQQGSDPYTSFPSKSTAKCNTTQFKHGKAQ